MNNENRKIVQAAVSEAGDYLKGKLPDHPDHDRRNSYAHVWRAIKEEMGRTYSDCADEDLPRILEIVKREKEAF